MATYYKYAERSADSTINWAEVGKNMTDMLQEEARIREAKKAAIDEESRKLGETLSNQPMGDFEPANQFALDFAGTAQESRLIQDNLLRSGMLRPKDYAIMRQNLTDGTKTMFDLSKAYQEEAARKMERMKETDPAKKSQLLESWFMEQVEGLGNLSQAKGVINQTNGQVSIGKMIEGKDGVMTLDPNYNYTVSELNTRIKQDFDYFDVDKAMLQEEAMLGEAKSMVLAEAKKAGTFNKIYTVIDKKQGAYLTEEEEAALQAAVDNAPVDSEEQKLAKKRQQEALAANSYLAAEDNIIKSKMVNQFNTSSILTNNLNGYTTEKGVFEEYTYEFDEKKTLDENGNRKQNVILIKRKSSGALELDFTDEQIKEAEDFLRLNLRSKISTSEEAKTSGLKGYSPYQQAVGRLSAEEKFADKEALGVVTLWNKVLTAKTNRERKTAVDALVDTQIARDNGIEDVDFSKAASDGKFTIYFNDGRPPMTKDYDVENITLLEHAELGALIHGISQEDKLIDQIERDKFSTNKTYGGDIDLSNVQTTTRFATTAAENRLTEFNNDLEEAGTDRAKLKALADEAGLRIQTDGEDGTQTLVTPDGKEVMRGSEITMNSKGDLTDEELRQGINAARNNKSAKEAIISNRKEGAKDASGNDGGGASTPAP